MDCRAEETQEVRGQSKGRIMPFEGKRSGCQRSRASNRYGMERGEPTEEEGEHYGQRWKGAFYVAVTHLMTLAGWQAGWLATGCLFQNQGAAN